MKEVSDNLLDGIKALPAFPVVYVTIGDNVMVAAAFHFYSYNPPSLMVGIKSEKYSYELINNIKEFAINIPNNNQLDKLKICGSVSGRQEKDKFSRAGLTYKRADKINANIINECDVNIECKVVQKIEYPGSHNWFIGEIEQVHIDSNYKRGDAMMFWLGQFRALGDVVEGSKDEEIF